LVVVNTYWLFFLFCIPVSFGVCSCAPNDGYKCIKLHYNIFPITVNCCYSNTATINNLNCNWSFAIKFLVKITQNRMLCYTRSAIFISLKISYIEILANLILVLHHEICSAWNKQFITTQHFLLTEIRNSLGCV